MNLDLELGRASSLAQTGRFAEAIAAYRRLLARAPGHPEATHFLGICLAQSGQADEGLDLLGRSVQLAPQNAMYRQNYAVMLGQAGRNADAERELLALLKDRPDRLAPGDAAAASNLGFCLLERGDVEGALEWLRRSLAADARNPMAHINLGNALRIQGDVKAAVDCYQRAIVLAPRLASAHYDLAMARRDLGDAKGSLEAARTAVHCAPGHAAAWQLFAERVAELRFTAWDADLAADLERLFSQTEVEVQACAEAVWSLVRTGPRGRLFLLLLEHGIVADEAFEAEMTALRRELLHAPVSLELACALAQQCFLNEYIWPESAKETAFLSLLEKEAKTPLQIATLAMYRPVHSKAEPASGGQAFERMWRRLVEEPAAEAAIAVPALTPIEDAVSRKVRAQYEDHPYPRWHRAPAAAAFPLPRMLRALFPHVDAAKLAAPDAPEILIAGCGTGRHAAITAQLQPRARVLAVDISRASLACAMRRAKELGLGHVEFAQADILQLGALDRRFDLIECSGVLHHMQDPVAGWKVLLSLLKPGGFMKLGLYSELGRREVVAAREVAAGCDVRAARQAIFELPADHLARGVTRLRDFYSASGARDLILHVQEHRFTIGDLEEIIRELNVEFLGFESMGKSVARSFGEWAALEQAEPDTFSAMYQFWIRR